MKAEKWHIRFWETARYFMKAEKWPLKMNKMTFLWQTRDRINVSREA